MFFQRFHQNPGASVNTTACPSGITLESVMVFTNSRICVFELKKTNPAINELANTITVSLTKYLRGFISFLSMNLYSINLNKQYNAVVKKATINIFSICFVIRIRNKNIYYCLESRCLNVSAYINSQTFSGINRHCESYLIYRRQDRFYHSI